VAENYKLEYCGLVSPSISDGRILCIDELGNTLLYNAESNVTAVMPCINEFKGPVSVSASAKGEEGMYIVHDGVEEQRPRDSVPRCLLLAVPSAAALVGLQTTRQLLHRPGRSVCLQWRRNDALLRHGVSRMEACCPSTAGPCTFLFSSSAWASPSADPLTCARSTSGLSARRSDGSTATTTDHVADEPHVA
jgi:hypothetical protein